VERLRRVNVAAEERVQREERRRAAEAAKSAGNAAFQAQHFERAIEHYTEGLEAGSASEEPALAASLHCNRAAAHQACGRYLHALADCFRAEALDASYTRVYHRRADAYWAVGAWEAAAKVRACVGAAPVRVVVEVWAWPDSTRFRKVFGGRRAPPSLAPSS